MKNLFTYLKALWGAWGNLQSKDVRHDCRLTVGSPSGRYCSGLMRFVFILAILLTVGVGNVWGTTASLTNAEIKAATAGNSYASRSVTSSSGTWSGTMIINTSTGYVQINKNKNNYYLGSPTFAGGVTQVSIETNNSTASGRVFYICSSTNTAQPTSGDLGQGSTPSSNGTATISITGSPTSFYIYSNGAAYIKAVTVTYTAACAGTQLETPEVTTTPSNQQIQLSWPAVDHATKYQVSWNGGAFADATSPYTKSSITNGTSYTWAIKAIGNGSTYCDSEVNEGTTKPGSTIRTVIWKVNGETYATTYVASGDHLMLPASPSPCAVGKVFAGWSETNIGSTPTDTKPTFISSQTTISANKTYHAVFATRTANSYTKGDINDLFPGQTVLIVNETGNVALSDEAVSGKEDQRLKPVSVTISSSKITSMSNSHLIWTVENRGLKYNFKTGTGYLRATASGNDKLSCGSGADPWTLTANSGKYYMNSTNSGTSRIQYYSSGTCFQTYGSNATGNNYSMSFFVPTYTQYITQCCTQLGSINGSVSRTVPGTATLTWSNVTGAEKYQVKVPGSSSHNDWTDATSGVSVTGLACGTAYTAYFRAIDTNGSHCTEGPESTTAVPAVSWSVDKTGVTNVTAASLSAIPSTTCASGFGPITIEAATGYELPSSVTVTGGTGSWTKATGSLSVSSVTGNVTITLTPTCVSPEITADPADASYYVGDAPAALSVTAAPLASGTLTYLWKVSTNGGSTWSDATGTNNTFSYSGASLSTASVGTLKFKCIVGNSEGGCTVESEEATITVANASYFPNGKTIFIQAESSSAWSDANYDCVKAWFHTAGGSETAQTTYWLFDATGGDAGKKLFATVVPATGDLPYLDIQRFTHDCSLWRNKNGGCSYSDANGSNTIRSTGNTDTYDAKDDYIRWNATGVTMNLMSSDAWLTPVASMTDQGSGIWSGSYEYTPSNTSTEYVIATNYNGNIGNAGSNSNATLSGMVVGSTYDVTATLDIKDHSLEMSKTFVKGTVHFNLQGHGLAISDLTNVTAGSKISAPSPAPSATGYTFGGWFTDAECTDEWTFASDEVNETMTLYAKWTANVYTITKTLTNVSNTGLPASFTYTGATTTALNSTFTVDATNFFMPSSIAVTMGGTPLTAGTDYTYNNSTGAFTFSAVITGNIVITATATAKLKSIAITTQPTTRKYFAGESFSSTGAVVTATMGDGSTKTVSATWTPSGALSAGTSQTVTASYSEGGIDQTATTTIDVYSVTVNKKNEDGDAIDVAGVTATWTVGTKALAAGVGSTKYTFKEWQVTGATAASTTSANTTLSNPTANVVVNAVFWKPRVVKWSVNGNDSYTAGGATTTVAYNGTISAVPTNPSGLVCAGTFVAWTDADHNNGTTAKPNTSYYESKLFTAANQFPNITAATTTFYAVFAEGTGAAVNTTMWGETWTDATVSNGSSGQSDANPDDNCSTTKGTTIYGAASISYTQSDNSNVYCRNENSAGGTAPELYIKSSNSWTISGIPTGGAATLSLTYATNKTPTVTVSTTELGKTPTISGANKDKTITTDGASTITIQFSTSENTRVDNVELRVATVSLTNYVTECDANMVKVTYDANGGSTTCAGGSHDKRNDYTVCSSAPTRDYYTFASWLCSADDEVYVASATIDDAVIDADFSLTAQWTPVTYNISYELDGGTNNVGNPATYNVTTATITLQDPTKGHDRFEGWYSTYSAGVYSDPVTEIPLGSHDNITLYAKWTERHEIVFDADGETTTIYRADDEAMDASVAEQGSVPSDPSAPSTCSTKVFVGWSESTIDDETDTEPTDLFDGTGAVDEDKHYYAVWATGSSVPGPVTVFEDALYGKAANNTTFSTYGSWKSFGYVYGRGISTEGVRVSSGDYAGYLQLKAGLDGLASVDTIKFKIMKYGDETATITLSSYSGNGTYDDATSVTFTASSKSAWEEKTCILRDADATTDISFEGVAKNRIFLKDIKITKAGMVTKYTGYATSCCATKVTLSQNNPSNGTIEFGKTSVGTCGEDKEVSLRIAPAAGYQLATYSVATGDGKVGTKTDPGVSLNNNSSAEQNLTLTFAEDANGAYNVTASFTEMVATAWTWTKHVGGATITTEPVEVYVGQKVQADVSYEPAGLLSNHTNASAYSYPQPWSNANLGSPAKAGDHFTVTGTNAGSTSVTLTHNDGLTKAINYTVVALPLVHFVDKIHGEEFANVVATVSGDGWTVTTTRPTPTHSDVDDPGVSYNTCERQHLHLIGWIESEWADAHPNAEPGDITDAGAGNYYAAGANIDLVAQNGKTFYAVWAKFE